MMFEMPTSGVQRRWSVVLVSVQAVPSFRGFARTVLIARTPDRPYRSHLSPITLLSRHISFNFLTFTPSHHHPGLNAATTTEVCKLFCFPIIRNIPPVSNHIFSWCRPKTLFWLNQHVSFACRRPKTSEQIEREICVRN